MADSSSKFFISHKWKCASNDKFFICIFNRSLSDSEDEADGNDLEYPSFDSVPSDNSSGNGGTSTFSPGNSEPPSITESMLMVNDILSDKGMDRNVKIDKLEAILSAVNTMPDESVSINHTKSIQNISLFFLFI